MSPNLKGFPTALKHRRVALGLTQRELAGRIGVSMRTVLRWEHGESCAAAMEPHVYYALARELGDDVTAHLKMRPVQDEAFYRRMEEVALVVEAMTVLDLPGQLRTLAEVVDELRTIIEQDIIYVRRKGHEHAGSRGST